MPRYKVIGETTIVNSTVYHRGAEVTSSGWPTVHMEPLDEDARRIANYYRRRHHAPGLPLSPYSAAFGCFYLPMLLPDVPGRKINGAIRDDAVQPGMPRYTVNSDVVTELNGLTVTGGDEFTFIAWPSFWFVPVNDEARRVADYFAENSDNPKLPPCPWNEFTRSVFLPNLPPIDRSYRPRENVPHDFTPPRESDRMPPPLLDRDPLRPSGHLTGRRAAKAARQQAWQEFEP